MSDDFEETTDVPVGRKSRVITDVLWNKLEDSAKRKVGFSRIGTAEVIEELRKDLSSGAVRNKYEITTASAKLEDGRHKLTFAAQFVPAPAPAPQPPTEAEVKAPAPAPSGKAGK